jgi:hypothetical protein
MKCSDVERLLPDIIDGTTADGSAPGSAWTVADQYLEIQSHLKSCPDCSELVSDLKWIASESRQLSNSEEPAPRVWVRIAAELRAEGIIKDSEMEPGRAPARPAIAPARQHRWSAWWLAPAAIAILAAGSYVLNHRASPQGTEQAAQGPAVQQTVPQQPATQQSSQQPLEQPAATQQAAKRPVVAPAPVVAQNPTEQAELSPPPSAEDQQFLSEVSDRAPSMRATYENQLRAVNAEIRETQAYIRQHPGELDARQHLMEVFQQKAMLYQMALDRIQ